MANSRSARKRIRSNLTKQLRNRAVRSAVRTEVSQARRALLAGAADPQAELRAAASALDRAAEKGILHRNNASRRKSRLAALAARLGRAGEGEQARLRAAAAGGEKGRTAGSGTRATASGSGPGTKDAAPKSAPAARAARKATTKRGTGSASGRS